MTQERRYVDVAAWQDLGGLQEANRLFFHLHGWALEATRVGKDGWTLDSPRVRELAGLLIVRGRVQTGEARDDEAVALDVARQALNDVYPPGSVFLSGVWDCSEDPEGVVFGDWPEEYVAKAKTVHQKRVAHFAARSALFYGDDGPWHAPQDAGEEDETDVEPFNYVWNENSEQ